MIRCICSHGFNLYHHKYAIHISRNYLLLTATGTPLSVYQVVCIYLRSRHGPIFLAEVTQQREARWCSVENILFSLKGDDKDASPISKGLAVIQVAVMASNNDFEPKSITTGTSQLWIVVAYIPGCYTAVAAAAAVRHRVPHGKNWCCGSLHLIPVFSFSSFKHDLFSMSPLAVLLDLQRWFFSYDT